MHALAMTEHGNVSSHVALEKAAKAQGVKALFGCELYCGEVGENGTQRKNHLTVIAETQEGYSNLLRVVSQGWSDFYYEPTVSGRVLSKHKQGLVVLSGCTGSLLATSLVGGKNIAPEDASYARGRDVARRFKRTFGDAYYLEVQGFPELANVKKINEALGRLSKELGIPLAATGDVHYTLPTENEMQKILHNVRAGHRQSLEDMARTWGYDVKLCPPPSDQHMLSKLIATGLPRQQAIQAILNTEEIAQRCTVTLPKLPQLRYPIPAGYADAGTVWRDWLRQGWRYRGCDKLPPKERRRYREKLQYEMNIIEQKDFIDYFLVVSDLVKFAKDTGIPVGPARGSAAASLVCYLLRITEVDPMLFPGLIFERFIDLTRQDLPDIDLDFDSERRHEIRAYLVSKYGSAQVSNIGTFTGYKAKNSLDDVARVYKIPKYEVDTVKDLLLERSSGDLRASATIEDTVAQFEAARNVFERYPDLAKATLLEGNIKGMGVHAAGLVVSNGPITDVCAVYQRKVKGVLLDVVSPNKKDAEYLGLLKIDVLGLSTMTMLAEALRQAGLTLEDLYAIPLDDTLVIDGFKRNDVVGIFQFDGRAMRSVNAELQPDDFREVCDANALARPGPLHSGASAEYIDVKRGRKPRKYGHPLLEAITGSTHGQIVYQEQILRVVREIGGFDWTHAAYIRKIISQKIGEQAFNAEWGRFWTGAQVQGLSEAEAHEIWNNCITAGVYAFNNAHCLTGDAVVNLAGGHGLPGTSMTLEQMWHRIHFLLPERKGRYYKFPGPCIVCGLESKKYNRGQCIKCARWRRDFNKRGRATLSLDGDGRIRPRQIVGVFCNGLQKVYQLVLSDGTKLRGTGNHKVMTTGGWVMLEKLNPGMEVLKNAGPEKFQYVGQNRTTKGDRSGHGFGTAAYVNGGYVSWQKWRAQAGSHCEMCGCIPTSPETSHKDGDRTNNVWENLQLLCPSCHRKFDTEHNNSIYGGWHKGLITEFVTVEEIYSVGEEVCYDLQMEGPEHNYIANGIVTHNTVSYGMIAWWTMWFKVHYPEVFYAASLIAYGDKKQLELLRDADRHGLKILPPDPALSVLSWSVEEGALRGGLIQVPGIGPSIADKMLEYRGEHEVEFWEEYQAVKGIGPKKVAACRDFSETDDPYGVHRLHRLLQSVRGISRRFGLPRQTHTSLQVPYSRGEDVECVWYGVISKRNLRELFELHFSRTGEELDRSTVKDPHLNEWVVMLGQDEDEYLSLTVDRWKYPRFREAVWGIKLDHDVVIIRGIKRGAQARRALYVKQMWVVDPSDDNDEVEEFFDI